jgi:hypothetical protein
VYARLTGEDGLEGRLDVRGVQCGSLDEGEAILGWEVSAVSSDGPTTPLIPGSAAVETAKATGPSLLRSVRLLPAQAGPKLWATLCD